MFCVLVLLFSFLCFKDCCFVLWFDVERVVVVTAVGPRKRILRKRIEKTREKRR